MERQWRSAYFLMAISILRIANSSNERTDHATPSKFIRPASIGADDSGSQQPVGRCHPSGRSLCLCRRYSGSGRLVSALKRAISTVPAATHHQQHKGLQGSWPVDTLSRTHNPQRRVSPSAAITTAGGSCTTGSAGLADCLPAKLRPCILPTKKAITTPARCAAHRPENASNLTASQRPRFPLGPRRPGATHKPLGRALSPAVCAPFFLRFIDRICLKCDRAISPR